MEPLKFKIHSVAQKPEGLAQERLEKSKERLTKLIIEHIKNDTRRTKLLNAMEKLAFDTAPASSNPNYHGCYRGGLLEHTLIVVSHMLALNEAWGASCSKESLVLCGVLHDIAKAGYAGQPYYIKNIGKPGYKYNTKLTAVGQNLMSIHVAAEAGIELAPHEVEAIMAQDGLFTEEGKSVFLNKKSEPDKLAYVLHFSDWWAARIIGI